MDSRNETLLQGVLALSTPNAARVLDKKPQTLRRWACLQCGPIQPVRVNGRLLWRVADLKRLLGIDDEALA